MQCFASSLVLHKKIWQRPKRKGPHDPLAILLLGGIDIGKTESICPFLLYTRFDQISIKKCVGRKDVAATAGMFGVTNEEAISSIARGKANRC